MCVVCVITGVDGVVVVAGGNVGDCVGVVIELP